MDAFDADVLIYAASPGHELGRRVLGVLPHKPNEEAPTAMGSLALVPEVLIKPMRSGPDDELQMLSGILGQIDLHPIDEEIVGLATTLGAQYGLKTIDAVHLATAVNAGADRFITNNRRDFPTSITEIEICYPADLPEPG